MPFPGLQRRRHRGHRVGSFVRILVRLKVHRRVLRAVVQREDVCGSLGMLCLHLVDAALRLTAVTEQALYQLRALDVSLDAVEDGLVPIMTALIRHDLPLIAILITTNFYHLVLRR